MLESCVLCCGIDDGCESKLLDACETLHEWVLHDSQEHAMGNLDKTEYGVADDLTVVHDVETPLTTQIGGGGVINS